MKQSRTCTDQEIGRFGLVIHDQQIADLVSASADFIRDIQEHNGPRWLSLLGTSGTGKTHCARKIWNWFSGQPVVFHPEKNASFAPHSPPWCRYIPRLVHWPRKVSQLRGGEGYEELTDMGKWPLLVLDDILAERDPSGFAIEQLYGLLDARVGMWTVITSNLTSREIGQKEARIADRMLRNGGVIVRLSTLPHSKRAQ